MRHKNKLSNEKHWVLATPCKSTYMNIGYDEDWKAQSTSALKRKYKRGRLKFSQIWIPESVNSHKPKNPYMWARKSLRPITTSIQYYTPKLKTSQQSIKITQLQKVKRGELRIIQLIFLIKLGFNLLLELNIHEYLLNFLSNVNI